MGSAHSRISLPSLSSRGSLRRREGSSNGGADPDPSTSSRFASELSNCDEACLADPELRRFGSTLEERTRGAIAAVESDATSSSAVSLRSLRSVTDALLDTDHDAVEIILKCGDDFRTTDPELTSLVQDYFENSVKTLDFCVCLDSCLRRARDRQLVLRLALNCFRDDDGAPTKYARTLEELRKFREAGDPFTPEFFSFFDSVRSQQRTLLENLRTKRRKLDKKLKNVKAWSRISTVMFVSVFSAMLICSVVAAAMVAPPLVTALVSAGTAAVGPMGKWFNSLWKGYVDNLEMKKEAAEMMEKGARSTIEELRSIGALVGRLETEIKALSGSAEFALRGEEAVKVGVEDIGRRMDEFMNCVEGLEKHVERCRNFVIKTRIAVLKKLECRE